VTHGFEHGLENRPGRAALSWSWSCSFPGLGFASTSAGFIGWKDTWM
jgi:hypothetical protein